MAPYQGLAIYEDVVNSNYTLNPPNMVVRKLLGSAFFPSWHKFQLHAHIAYSLTPPGPTVGVTWLQSDLYWTHLGVVMESEDDAISINHTLTPYPVGNVYPARAVYVAADDTTL